MTTTTLNEMPKGATFKEGADKFGAALEAWLTGCEKIYNANCERNKMRSNDREFRLQWGQKRVRVITAQPGEQYGSAFAFIDYATGDVLKPAGFAARAKHARGNLFDEKGGLGTMGPYGPAYLR